MRIGFASEDWAQVDYPGGACHARIVTPASALKAAGHEVHIGYGVGAHKQSGLLTVLDTDNVPMCDPPDVMVLQRWMHQDAPAAIARAVAAGQAVVNDVDDHYEGLATTNVAFVATHPRFNEVSNRAHYRKSLAASSMITVSTPFLQQRMTLLRKPVVLLRNAIDLTRFVRQPVRNTSEHLTVGWVGATAWRSSDLETLQGILWPFLERGGHEFLHAGAMKESKEAGPLIGLPDGTAYTARPICDVWTYPHQFTGIDIGLVPLNSIPFNEAKSAIKGMEYNASGIPYVAAALPEQTWYAGGLLAKRPRDWIRALDALQDPAHRIEVERQGYERVQREDISRRWPEWELAYSQALSLSLRAFATRP